MKLLKQTLNLNSSLVMLIVFQIVFGKTSLRKFVFQIVFDRTNLGAKKVNLSKFEEEVLNCLNLKLV